MTAKNATNPLPLGPWWRTASSSARACVGFTTTLLSTAFTVLGAVHDSEMIGFVSKSFRSTACHSALTITPRLRWTVPAAAGSSLWVRVRASSTCRVTCASAKSPIGRVLRDNQSRVRLISAGTVGAFLARTLNAHETRALLNRSVSGRPRSVVSNASVAVVNACAVFLRELPASDDHLLSTYRQAKSYQLISLSRRAVDTGSPASTVNASPFRCAEMSSERKLSASAFVRKVVLCLCPATDHRTLCVVPRAPLYCSVFQIRTSYVVITRRPLLGW